MNILIENYLDQLYQDNRDKAKEIQGHSLPVEGDDKPDWISQCMSIPCDRKKINCLRKVRDMAAMNPFYQYRIDRFVDAITQTYEPTVEPGTLPGSEFQQPKLHESENVNEFIGAALNVIFWGQMVSSVIIGSNKLYKNYLSKAARFCNDAENKDKCMNTYKVQGLKDQITFIKSKSGACSKTKNSKECKEKLNAKIGKLNSKISKLKHQYSKDVRLNRLHSKIRDIENE